MNGNSIDNINSNISNGYNKEYQDESPQSHIKSKEKFIFIEKKDKENFIKLKFNNKNQIKLNPLLFSDKKQSRNSPDRGKAF